MRLSEIKSKLKFKHGVAIMAVLVIFLQIKSCSDQNRFERAVNENKNYLDTVMTYMAKDGTLVEYNNAIETSVKEFFASQEDSVKAFLENIRIPEPSVYTVVTERFYIDSIPAQPLHIKDCDFDTTFSVSDKYYNIGGRITDDYLKVDSIVIPNKSTVVVGDLKTKWWKRPQYSVIVRNSNPYIRTQGVQSFTVQDKMSRWSVSPGVGYGFYYDPMKGNAGHGLIGGVSLSYKLIGWKKK